MADRETYASSNAASELAVVFGGSGFIGRHLNRSLVAHGNKVVSVDLVPLSPPIPGVEHVTQDIRRPIATNFAANALPTTVYNLAAIHRTPGHPDREYYDTNVGGALNVTEFCRELDIKRIVFTSSISVYGPQEHAVDETSSPAPSSPYGHSKWQAERIHENWQREDPDRRLVIVRPAVVFGSGEKGNFTRLANALRAGTFVYPGRRDTIKSCGYVEELVESIRFATGLSRNRFLYNFCYPTTYTIEDICDAYHRVAGFARPRFMLPYRALHLAARAFETVSILGLESAIHRERIEKLVRSTNIRPRALCDAGYVFKGDLADGLKHWRDASDGQFV